MQPQTCEVSEFVIRLMVAKWFIDFVTKAVRSGVFSSHDHISPSIMTSKTGDLISFVCGMKEQSMGVQSTQLSIFA